MDFRILGRLEVLDGGRDVAPARAQPRRLLALLLLHANERLATDRLIEALWGEDPPATAEKALQGHISVLRKLLGSSRIRTEGTGYRLVLEPGELDRDRFVTAVAEARIARDAAGRAARFAGALALWRGDPLADLAGERFAGPEIAHLEEARLAAFEARAEAELDLGRHAELIPDLALLVERHPLSEGLRASLMLALYRSGRQSDALRAYREGRRHLADELGIDPGAELQRLERRILDQDPALDAPRVVSLRPAPPRQERKTITLLVAEVAAGTPMDPEDLDRVVGATIDRIRVIVARHGGTAERVFANGLLGIFGAPRAHDDDPVRAVRAALELRDAPGPGPLQLRIGIDTGMALVTIDGPRVAVTGEVLGTASRLQLAAELGSIVVSDVTHRLTEPAFEYQAGGPGIWAPIDRRAAPPPAAPDAPFVGRSDELAVLERLFARARDERSVQLVTIMAEPGGGKSRLLRELRARLDASATPPLWRQGSCLPYGEGVTYSALGEIVKTHAGILESDDGPASAAKVAAAVADLEPDDTRRAWLERSLRALVGIERTAASGDREQAFAAWRQLLEAIAGRAPLVVAFEDIHWADDALLEFLDNVVARASGVPLMVICTARLELLESHPAWAGGKRNATTIALEPLRPVDTEALLHALLGRPPDGDAVRRAGGNPLFAHELARVVGESAALEGTDVPESLQAVIAAHLDTLAPELKAVAADAAVVGEVFWPGAVATMATVDADEVEARLARLVAHDIARRRRPSSVERQTEYAFLHALVRDVAYAQIPRRDRIAKHRAVGDWIELLAGDRVGHHAELVAHHYVQALEIARGLGVDGEAPELSERARTFLTLAGEAARSVDIREAEPFFRRALDLTPADNPTHGRLLSRLSEVAELTGHLVEAERLSGQAMDELERHGDRLGAGEAMGVLVATMWRLGRPEGERRRVAAKAVRTLEQLEPGPELVRAYSRMATHELHAGRAGACGAWSRKALAVADRLGVPALKVQPLNHLGIARFESGVEAGIDDIREAVRLGQEAGLTWETATAHANLAATIWVTDGPRAALEVKAAAREFASSRGLDALEKQIKAESLWQLHDAGLWDDALVAADEVVTRDREGASSRVSVMAQTVKARILAERGDARGASDLEPQFLDRARELRDPQDLGPALAAGAATRLALGDVTAAAGLIEELERVTRGRDPSQRIHELPHAARICLAAGTIDVAEALVPHRNVPTYARARLCLASARAISAESRCSVAEAADLHATAADGWRDFGNPLEEAHARIGQARCREALGQGDLAAGALGVARRIGRGLGAVVLLRDADRVGAATTREV
ncbi:MAG TPA: BTAD domain-containing putative transcriptional regulator [Candidatus Dormibacteraeota bacterium]|nr:BTAD domain-containing putative transcriptional regulator [Candidatus Dormibacteraeota bacterium]